MKAPVVRVLKLLASAVFFAACWLRDFVLRSMGKQLPGRCTVLYYHAVPDEHRAGFERQMDDLLRFTEPIPAGRKSPPETGKHYAVVTFDDAYQSVLVNALPALSVRGIPSTVFVVPEMSGRTSWLSDSSAPREEQRKVMSAEEVRSLPEALVTVGSHSLTHADLTSLGTSEAAHELTESRRVLETLLRRPVTLFCFPYGACNEELFRLSHQAGYDRVFTTLPHSAFSQPNEFVTGRVRVDPTDWRLEFRLKLMGAYRWLPAAFAVKRGLLGRRSNTAAPRAVSPSV